MSKSIRIGLDVGGTFTDLYLLDETAGRVIRHKLPSTSDDPYKAPVQGMREIMEKAGVDPTNVRFVGLGTTVATNALLERKGAITGLITTRGFRDLLEIGRQKRPHVYDLFVRKPEPLVPRELRLEVRERTSSEGEEIVPLSRTDMESVIAELRCKGVTSLAVCFLNSYANPEHERAAVALLRAAWPEIEVTASHELLAEFREYERLSSTVLNAFLMPVMQRYMSRFKQEVGTLGIPESPFVMSSGGGVFTPELAGSRPIDTLFSGPSGGVSAAIHVSGAAGFSNLVTFDMGGTSTDVCLVRDGRPEMTTARSIDGLPVKSLAVDIHTVGAGGSSIAWIDAGGLLRVGPQSAGARPGPACYGDAGAKPTVTDANVVLGRLNQKALLDGSLPIDLSAAATAIKRDIAGPKGLSVEEAASAIIAISNTNIAQAIRYVSVERGLDPSDFALVAFGGAGPLHAAEVAQELGMAVLVPPSPGVLCAMGVLTKDIEIDLSQTRIMRHCKPGAEAEAAEIFAQLRTRAIESFAKAGLDPDGLLFRRSVDARYVGQNFELSVPIPGAELGPSEFEGIRGGFDAEHRRIYGYDQPEKELELVTSRIAACLPVPMPALVRAEVAGGAPPPVPVGYRRTFFAGVGHFLDCPIYRRGDLLPGFVLQGAAIIEQMDTTIVLPPNFVGRTDEYQNLVLTRS